MTIFYRYPDGYYPFCYGDMDTGIISSAEEALNDWLEGLDIDLPDEIWEDTRWDQSAEYNLTAISDAADYHGINLLELGYPLPYKVNENKGE